LILNILSRIHFWKICNKAIIKHAIMTIVHVPQARRYTAWWNKTVRNTLHWWDYVFVR